MVSTRECAGVYPGAFNVQPSAPHPPFRDMEVDEARARLSSIVTSPRSSEFIISCVQIKLHPIQIYLHENRLPE